MFSGMQLGKTDDEFRDKYLKDILASSGDSNIVIAKINDQVGWGAFAARDIAKDDYVVRYGGRIENSSTCQRLEAWQLACLLVWLGGSLIHVVLELVKDRSYSMQSGIEGVVLNSLKFRNLAAFINHSAKEYAPQRFNNLVPCPYPALASPNVFATCIFHEGVELAVLVALQDIPKGKQLFYDYEPAYFKKHKKANEFVDMSGGNPGEFPAYITL